MGITGPKPTPPALKILRGNPGGRPIPKTVKVEAHVPRCPDWLSPLARKEWRRTTRELAKVGLMTRLDLGLLAAYCEAMAQAIECDKYIQDQGGVAKYLEGRNSQTAMHLSTMRAALQFIRSAAGEFGMSPSSRGRIEIPEAPEKNEYLDW
jgi:P27 family predicted phage terminase small subunit